MGLCCGFCFVRCPDPTCSNQWKLMIPRTQQSWTPTCILGGCVHGRTKRESYLCFACKLLPGPPIPTKSYFTISPERFPWPHQIIFGYFGPSLDHLLTRAANSPTIFYIPHNFPYLPIMSGKVDTFSYNSLWKSHKLDQFTAVQKNMPPEDTHRREQEHWEH